MQEEGGILFFRLIADDRNLFYFPADRPSFQREIHIRSSLKISSASQPDDPTFAVLKVLKLLNHLPSASGTGFVALTLTHLESSDIPHLRTSYHCVSLHHDSYRNPSFLQPLQMMFSEQRKQASPHLATHNPLFKLISPNWNLSISPDPFCNVRVLSIG